MTRNGRHTKLIATHAQPALFTWCTSAQKENKGMMQLCALEGKIVTRQCKAINTETVEYGREEKKAKEGNSGVSGDSL